MPTLRGPAGGSSTRIDRSVGSWSSTTNAPVPVACGYAFGDAIGPDEYRAGGAWPSDPRSLSTALRLEQRGLVCEPGVVPPTSSPTTIGLGDAFAGGLVKVLAEARAGAPRLG